MLRDTFTSVVKSVTASSRTITPSCAFGSKQMLASSRRSWSSKCTLVVSVNAPAKSSWKRTLTSQTSWSAWMFDKKQMRVLLHPTTHSGCCFHRSDVFVLRDFVYENHTERKKKKMPCFRARKLLSRRQNRSTRTFAEQMFREYLFRHDWIFRPRSNALGVTRS